MDGVTHLVHQQCPFEKNAAGELTLLAVCQTVIVYDRKTAHERKGVDCAACWEARS
jgi:hypothetical protein